MALSRGDTIDKAISLNSDAEVVERIRETMPDSLEMLRRIACGDVPRNAQSILKAIETQLRFSQPLPKVTVEHQGAVGIAVINPYAESTEGQEADGQVLEASLVPPALPAPKAVAPIRRKKAPAPEPKA